MNSILKQLTKEDVLVAIDHLKKLLCSVRNKRECLNVHENFMHTLN